jgi:hypothetical protein
MEAGQALHKFNVIIADQPGVPVVHLRAWSLMHDTQNRRACTALGFVRILGVRTEQMRFREVSFGNKSRGFKKT